MCRQERAATYWVPTKQVGGNQDKAAAMFMISASSGDNAHVSEPGKGTLTYIKPYSFDPKKDSCSQRQFSHCWTVDACLDVFEKTVYLAMNKCYAP